MKRICLLGAAACCVVGGDVEAKSCRPTFIRARAKSVLVQSEAVFAIPVATVVVAVQPTLLYSYRAAAVAQATPSRCIVVGEAIDSLPRTAEAILRERCITCHRGDAPKGGLAFFQEDGGLIEALPRRAMLEMASPDANGAAQMPPGEANKLSAEDLEILRQWAEPPRDLRY